jgi:hypothetical protein
MKTPDEGRPEGDHEEERRRQFEDSRGLHERRELELDDEDAGDEPSSEKRRPRGDAPDEAADDEDTDGRESEEGGGP